MERFIRPRNRRGTEHADLDKKDACVLRSVRQRSIRSELEGAVVRHAGMVYLFSISD